LVLSEKNVLIVTELGSGGESGGNYDSDGYATNITSDSSWKNIRLVN
jgi:hypothetical protein